MPALTFTVLRSSSVQSHIIKQVGQYLSKELNTTVSVSGLDVSFLLNVVLDDLYVEDLNGDTLLYSEQVRLKVSQFRIKAKTASINHVVLKHPVINISKSAVDSCYNMKFLGDYFIDPDRIRKGFNWDLECLDVRIKDGHFTYIDNTYTGEKYSDKICFQDLDLVDFNLKINEFTFDKEFVSGSVQEISFIEKSGFVLIDISTEFLFDDSKYTISDAIIETNNSNINFSLIASPDINIDSTKQNIKNYYINGDILSSKIDFNDIAYFVPALSGINEIAYFSGGFDGKINDFKTNNLSLLFGNNTKLIANAHIVGLPDFKNATFNLEADEILLDIEDFNEIKLLDENNELYLLPIPEKLKDFEFYEISGKLSGSLDSVIIDMTLNTAYGGIVADLQLNKEDSITQYSYSGNIKTKQLDLAALNDSLSTFGPINADLQISGSGVDLDNLNANIVANISSVYFNNYTYNNIVFNAQYKDNKLITDAVIDDENLMMNFDGYVKYYQKRISTDFKANVSYANLNNLNFINSDTVHYFDANIDLQLDAANLDDYDIQLLLTESNYYRDNEEYPIESLVLNSKADKDGSKTLSLESDFIDCYAEGEFVIQDIGVIVLNTIYTQFAQIDPFKKDASRLKEISKSQYLDYYININDVSLIGEFIGFDLDISKGSKINGSFNSRLNSININAEFGSITMGKMWVENLVITGDIDPYSKPLISCRSDAFYLNDSIVFPNIALDIISGKDTLYYDFSFINSNYNNRYSLDFTAYTGLNFYPYTISHFDELNLVLNDSIWNLDKRNKIIIDTAMLQLSRVSLVSGDNEITFNGVISSRDEDKLDIWFEDVDISQFSWALNNIDVQGVLNGKTVVRNINEKKALEAELEISSFKFLDEYYGDLFVKSDWNAIQKAISINAGIIYHGNYASDTSFNIKGNYKPLNNEIAAKCVFNSFKAKALGPLLDGLVSGLRGKVSGELDVAGTLTKPSVTGRLKLIETSLVVDYLQTKYTVTGDVLIEENFVNLKDIIVNDQNVFNPKNSYATVSGGIRHDFFRDFELDLALHPNNFTCINTTSKDNSLYFGKIIGTGDISFIGPFDDIYMNLEIATDPNSILTVPMYYSGRIRDNNYITFVNVNAQNKDNERSTKLKGFSMDMKLDIDEDVTVRIDFDPTVGDRIEAKGNSNMRMSLTKDGHFNLYGIYTVTEGEYLFTLENVINKRLKVSQGGTLEWQGHTYDADINLKAIYDEPRCPIYDIVYELDSSESTKKNYKVNCILDLSGKLMNPDLDFGIELPNTDEQTRQLFYTALDTTNREEMTRQVISLLVLQRFTRTESLGNSSLGAVGVTSFEMLSNQMSNWLSQISNDFDIGFAYRPGDDINQDQVELALSTQLFHDKLSIDGNISNNANVSTNNSASLVGDVNVEYKLTDRVRVKAYNRSNDTDQFQDESPYTQGIGISYRREFDKFFRRKNKKNKENKEKTKD